MSSRKLTPFPNSFFFVKAYLNLQRITIFCDSFDLLSVNFCFEICFAIGHNSQKVSNKMLLEITHERFHVSISLFLCFFNILNKSLSLLSDISSWICEKSDFFNIFSNFSKENFISGCVELSLLCIYWVSCKLSTQWMRKLLNFILFLRIYLSKGWDFVFHILLVFLFNWYLSQHSNLFLLE